MRSSLLKVIALTAAIGLPRHMVAGTSGRSGPRAKHTPRTPDEQALRAACKRENKRKRKMRKANGRRRHGR